MTLKNKLIEKTDSKGETYLIENPNHHKRNPMTNLIPKKKKRK